MIRAVCLCAGLAGATAASQYPAFTQAYLQRLAGQVDALTVVVKDFDTSAIAAGLGREEALEQMTGTPFLTARQSDMRRTFARHARLATTLMDLRAATPLERIAMPQRMADPQIVQAAWSDFEPAMPLSAAGAVSAGGGFAAGWAVMLAALSLFARPFRRHAPKPAPPRPVKSDPPVARQKPVLLLTNPDRPRLMGERRQA